jgi:TonB-linked SusC/RagA family outer membrane protein
MGGQRFLAVGHSLFLALAMAWAGEVQAQDRGTVTGRVVQEGSLRPLAGAQVSIPGSGLGGLASGEGRFLILGVPAGEVTVRVQMIGFGTSEQTVTVVAGESVTVDFRLSSEALGLDEIVVTGTAGGQQRRAVANVVGSVDVESQLEASAPATLQQMLSGQVAGAYVQVGGGNVGSGGNIFIRGMSTMDLNSNPLVYVDGIRVEGGADGQAISRLNDFSPEDIERIEIIKGPAAATLYGTEASNGVIQIITKKGRSGEASFDMTVRQGANFFMNAEERVPDNFYLRPDGTVIRQNLIRSERERGTPMFRTGHSQYYGLSVRGGRDQLTYYLSGVREDEEGYAFTNEMQRTSIRSNLQLAATESLDISADLGIVRSFMLYEQDSQGNDMRRIIRGLPQTIDTPLRGFATAPPEIERLGERNEELNRATSSITLTHRPASWLNQRLVLGWDWTDSNRGVFSPRLDDETQALFGITQRGSKTVTHRRNLNETYDYNATASFDLSPTITSSTTAGLQYFSVSTLVATATGTDMPTPAVSTVSAAATRSATETFVENKTLGSFIQQTFGWQNQAFLTAAIRADANSAFGESFDAAYYPKFGATWVVSDSDFWNLGFLPSLKLRTAWGRSGLQPATFAAIQTYSPSTGPGDQPTVTTGNVGNPDLRPEVGSELEVGFDAALWDSRFNVEFTHYRQRTRDLIVQELVAPSSGFAGNRFVNIGEVANTGYELRLDTRPISTETLQLTLGGTVSHNRNELISLGGRQVQADTRSRWRHVEGYELGSMWSKKISGAEYDANNRLVNVTCQDTRENNFAPLPCPDAPLHYVGNPGPVWVGGFNQTLSWRNQLTLNANWVYNLDTRRYSTDQWARENTLQSSERAVLRLQGLLDPVEAAGLITRDVEHLLMPRDDFVRLREVSATWTFSDAMADRLGVSRASFTVSGRNLLTWEHPEFRALQLYDPEAKAVRSAPWPGWEQARMPLAQSVVTTMRITF